MSVVDTELPKTVLLIEDNAADARKIERGFAARMPNSTVVSMRTGMEALKYLRQDPPLYEKALTPDLIILDLHLPGMNGLEVLTWLKAHEPLRRIPVLVLSASKDQLDIAKTYEAHANAFISKPVGIDSLLELIDAIEAFWLQSATLWRAEA